VTISRFQFAVLVAVLIILFIFVGGPVWGAPFDLDRAIGWSYAPIPFAVAALLYLQRRRGRVFLFWPALLLDSLAVALTKFALTYLVALSSWIVVGPPPVKVAPPVDLAPSSAAPASPPHDMARAIALPPPGTVGKVGGRVLDAQGNPVANAIVFVASGVDQYVDPRVGAPVPLVHDGTRITPALAVVRVDEPISARATDGRMHPMRFQSAQGATLFTVPLLATGEARTIVLDKPYGIVRARCVAHNHTGEQDAALVVIDHPLHTTSAANGTFTIDGVPAGHIDVSALSPSGHATVSATIVAGGDTQVTLSIAPAP
jgi:hypothetical protein